MSGLLGALMLLVAAIALVACEDPSRLTAGARSDSAVTAGEVVASLGFDDSVCKDDAGGRILFVDRDAGVRLGATVTRAFECASLFCDLCFERELVIEATYDSHDQGAPGAGTVVACLRVQERDTTDHAFVTVESGPLAGYSMDGPVRSNAKEHGCR